MFVNKRTWTVLNENCVRVHVRWTEKSGNQIRFDWLIESDAPPRSFPGVSKMNITFSAVMSQLIRSYDVMTCIYEKHKQEEEAVLDIYNFQTS